MFFKRQKPVVVTYAQQLDQLRAAGYSVAPAPAGHVVVKGNFGALLADEGDKATIRASGLALRGELAELTDLGYQKIFRTASGRRMPAVAEHLQGLHDFDEALRQELGLTSLYNEGLGTVNEQHLYDRITARDSGHQPKPWEQR